MSNQNDIFKNLGEYEAEPPKKVTQNILNSPDVDKEIHEEAVLKKQFEQLQELEINPPVNAFAFIKNKIASSFKLSFLQEKEITPPPAAYTSILKKITSNTSKNNSFSTAVIRTIYRYKSVAAIIIIVLAGWFIYRSTSISYTPQNGVVKKDLAIPAGIKPDSAIAKITDSKIVESADKSIIAPEENYFNNQRMSVGDYNFSIINNDLLTTFASFNYQQIPSFIKDDNSKKFTICVDQYTAISVSESMSRMIGKMNRFRHNQKLTRGAKKTRATIEKWKKADEERFDKSSANNPLDAIDLARFIFN